MGQVLREQFERLVQILPRLSHGLEAAEKSCAEARHAASELSVCLGELAEAGIGGLCPADFHVVVTNGEPDTVTEEEAERMRRQWPGTFLLDLPRRELWVKSGKRRKKIGLGRGGLHWGIEKLLILGMSKPGRPFGHRTFEERFETDIGVSSARGMSRYVCILRRAIGDVGGKTIYLHTVAVDRSVSSSGQGYVFDPRWDYLVIEGHQKKAPDDRKDNKHSSGRSTAS